jgi:hypothetical protein
MADSLVTPVTVMFGGKPSKAAAKKPATKKAPVAKGTRPMPLNPVAYKEPSHAERMHNAAADEHVYATRDYVAGRMSSKQYAKVAGRARRIMSQSKPSR